MEVVSSRIHPNPIALVDLTLSKARQIRLLQTVVAASKTLFAASLLSVDYSLAPVIVGLLAFAIYNTNNLADIDEDTINSPEKTAFVVRWRQVIIASSVAASVGAMAIALWKGGIPGFCLTLVPFVAAVIYSVPLLPGGVRVKDVYLVNTVVVAAAWAIAVTYLPLVLGGTAPASTAVAVCLFFFLRTVVSVEVFNVRDVVGDRENEVTTLPVVLGIPRTKRLLWLFDVSSLLVIVGAATIAPLRVALIGGLIPIVCYSLVIEWQLNQRDDESVLCFAKDIEYLLMGVLVIAVPA